jgi:hypothetical protein
VRQPRHGAPVHGSAHALTQSYGKVLARESELLLNRQRQQHVREQLAQLEGELAQLATDEREGEGEWVMVAALAEADRAGTQGGAGA